MAAFVFTITLMWTCNMRLTSSGQLKSNHSCLCRSIPSEHLEVDKNKMRRASCAAAKPDGCLELDPTAAACYTSRSLSSGWMSGTDHRTGAAGKLAKWKAPFWRYGGGQSTQAAAVCRYLLGRGVNSKAEPLTIFVMSISTLWYS